MAGLLESPNVAQAVRKLEDTFQSTESNLKRMESKLEGEYRNMFDDANTFSDELRNPVKVMNRFSEVKSEYAKIKQDVVEIQRLQQEALTQVKAEFDKMLLALSSLESKVLHDDGTDNRTYEKEQQLSSLIGHMAEKSRKNIGKDASSEDNREQLEPSTSSS